MVQTVSIFPIFTTEIMKNLWQILFWVAVHAGLTFVFGKWFRNYTEAFYYVSMLFPVVLGTSLFFNRYLVPRYLFPRKFFLFGLYTFYMLVVSLCLELIVSIVSMLLMIKFQVNEYAVLVTDVFTLALVLYSIVLFRSFVLILGKYYADQQSIRSLREEKEKLQKGKLSIRSHRKLVQLPYDEILYAESLSDYIRIHRITGEVVESKMKISSLSKELPEQFVRIHRSFIVNSDRINSFSREEVRLQGHTLPVGRSFRQDAMKYLEA